jgi:hypothetical protein
MRIGCFFLLVLFDSLVISPHVNANEMVAKSHDVGTIHDPISTQPIQNIAQISFDPENLPAEIIGRIVNQLQWQDLLSLRRVSESWWKYFNSDVLPCDMAYRLKGQLDLYKQLRNLINQKDPRHTTQYVKKLMRAIECESTYNSAKLPPKHFEKLYKEGVYTLGSPSWKIRGSYRGQNDLVCKIFRKEYTGPLITPEDIANFLNHKEQKIVRLYLEGNGGEVQGAEGNRYPWGLSAFKGLEHLSLQEIALKNFAVIGLLQSLRIVELRGLHMTKLPEEMGGLPNLCSISIKNCKELVDLTAVSEMLNLTEFTLENNTALTKLPKFPPKVQDIVIWQQPSITNWEDTFNRIHQVLNMISLQENGMQKLPNALKDLSYNSIFITDKNLPPSEIDELLRRQLGVRTPNRAQRAYAENAPIIRLP